jgi:putative transposase
VSFDSQIVRKRQHRLTGVDQIVLSLTGEGLDGREISAHFAEVYGRLGGDANEACAWRSGV